MKVIKNNLNQCHAISLDSLIVVARNAITFIQSHGQIEEALI